MNVAGRGAPGSGAAGTGGSGTGGSGTGAPGTGGAGPGAPGDGAAGGGQSRESVQVVCGHCDSVVRLPRARMGDAPRCPKCHAALFEGKPLTLTAGNFDKHLERGDVPLVVDFWAPWCGPCIAMAPFFEAVAKKLEPKMRFGKLNTEEHPAPAGRFNIRSIPTLIVFRSGKEIARQIGAMDAASLTRWLNNVSPL